MIRSILGSVSPAASLPVPGPRPGRPVLLVGPVPLGPGRPRTSAARVVREQSSHAGEVLTDLGHHAQPAAVFRACGPVGDHPRQLPGGGEVLHLPFQRRDLGRCHLAAVCTRCAAPHPSVPRPARPRLLVWRSRPWTPGATARRPSAPPLPPMPSPTIAPGSGLPTRPQPPRQPPPPGRLRAGRRSRGGASRTPPRPHGPSPAGLRLSALRRGTTSLRGPPASTASCCFCSALSASHDPRSSRSAFCTRLLQVVTALAGGLQPLRSPRSQTRSAASRDWRRCSRPGHSGAAASWANNSATRLAHRSVSA